MQTLMEVLHIKKSVKNIRLSKANGKLKLFFGRVKLPKKEKFTNFYNKTRRTD